MVDSYIQVAPDGSGKKMHTYLNGELHDEGIVLTTSAGIPYVTDSDSIPVYVDKIHYEIHHGDHYTAIVADGDVDIIAPKYVSLTAPDTTKRMHLFFMVSSDNGFLMEFYENPTLNAAGTAVPAYNNNRNSSNTATLVIKQDCTTQVPNNDGTLLNAQYAGGSTNPAARSSGEVGIHTEWILKQNEEYIVKITTAVDNSKVNILFEWYEE